MRGILESAKLFSESDSWVVISAKFLRLSFGAVEKDIGVVKGKGQLLASSGLPRPRPWPIDNEHEISGIKTANNVHQSLFTILNQSVNGYPNYGQG